MVRRDTTLSAWQLFIEAQSGNLWIWKSSFVAISSTFGYSFAAFMIDK